ncbi:hypothetical protein GGQ74_000287 [Desulfobaculum xiamenense]|uniref:UPF0235 protein GGQ74_000287 n=1 Tax=Desulfobaculum xiamenense TaxID=995050 RepID=A0A846QHY6_9BACT|nr:DUF167 domain-containing protein [Desulfobaculum xiamenense]NJB66647.1 hypothetical protein [Desulfobaculum xiamenense]
MTQPEYVRRKNDDCWELDVWVQPGAKRSEVDGIHDGCLKVRLMAPAVENKANKALTEFLASTFGVRKGNIRIAKGEKSRRKTIVLETGSEPQWPV